MRIKRNVYGIILCMFILGWQTGESQQVYGSDEYSEFQSYDTGGFDMDIGEGSGQIPDNWDSVDNRNGNQPDDEEIYGDYSGTGNAGESFESSGQGSAGENIWSNWSGNNDTWQDSTGNTQWGNTQAESESYYGTDNEENAGSGNSGDSGNAGRGNWNESDNGISDSFQISGSESDINNRNTENHGSAYSAGSDEVSSPKISSSPTSDPIRKPKKVKTLTPTPKVSNNPRISPESKKQQKLALSYYETNGKAAPASDAKEDKNTADEKLPEFLIEIQDSHIQLIIKQNIPMTPLQILSFRINGKECAWHWQGQKLTAELPKNIANIKKAEFLLFMSSGKLYHEIMDLKDEQ